MKTALLLLVASALALSGCAGGSSQDPELSVSHAESSERTVVTIASVPSPRMQYEDLSILVDGKEYEFGQFANFELRRYQVAGKTDAIQSVEMGDRITIPAVGLVQVRILFGQVELAAFEANIPDNLAPGAPMLLDPAGSAEGVSRLPTFRWEAVKDPSGVSYTLQYSLDPAFQAIVFTTTVENLAATMHGVSAGKELLQGTKHYWRVQAVDGAGNASPWSLVREFTTQGSVAG